MKPENRSNFLKDIKNYEIYLYLKEFFLIKEGVFYHIENMIDIYMQVIGKGGDIHNEHY
jgi:hypothetical protein